MDQDRSATLIAAVGESLDAHVVEQRWQKPTVRRCISKACEVKLDSVLAMQPMGVVHRAIELFASTDAGQDIEIKSVDRRASLLSTFEKLVPNLLDSAVEIVFYKPGTLEIEFIEPFLLFGLRISDGQIHE